MKKSVIEDLINQGLTEIGGTKKITPEELQYTLMLRYRVAMMKNQEKNQKKHLKHE